MNRVHIEFQRVQTWLFAVPRLRAMVGANTLLGEVLRVSLPALARKETSWRLAPGTGDYPGASPHDPIRENDDPAADARDGLVSRDGGHFEACFAAGAVDFAKAARALLGRELPGLRFRISVDEEEIGSADVAVSKELPVLAPCEWTGRGLASKVVRQGTESAHVSSDVSLRHEAARRSEKGNSQDLANLLLAKTALGKLPRPQTFQELAGDGYLALIHADGNGVGAAAGSGDVERSAFFHRNRVLLRRALCTAIDASCRDTDATPLVLLMLGGDDVLVICRAGIAMPFVVDLCQELAGIQHEDEGAFELTLGVGVVIARPTIPIHRLHETAERLAASAKRRFRGLPPNAGRSVVDWAVYTTSSLDDFEEARRRDWIRGTEEDIRILSQRPVDVLGTQTDSLQGLLKASRALEDSPRSQLRYLLEQLPRGRALSEMAFAELPSATRKAFPLGVWIRHGDDENGPLMTSVLDVVDLYEIGRLGRAGIALVKDDEEEGTPHVQG